MFKNHIIIRTLTTFILPYIMLYAIYIQFNGEVSPGGGFQAGVIFASSIIGLDFITEKNNEHKFFLKDFLIIISTLGVVLYAGVGLISMFYDNNYLNYYSLLSDKIKAQHLGIFLVEIGVGLTVAATTSLIYFSFKEQEEIS